MGVIEHFEEGPQIALNEAYRVLKVNGTLIVAVPYQNVYNDGRIYLARRATSKLAPMLPQRVYE